MLPIGFLIRILVIGCVLHLYVGMRLIPAATVGLPIRIAGALLLAGCLLTMAMGMASRFIVGPPYADRLAWLGMLLMGFFSTLLMLTIARDLVLLTLWIIAAISNISGVAEAVRSSTALAVPLIALMLTALGFYFARRSAAVKTVDIPIVDLSAGLQGFTIVQISDIHVGPTIKRRYVEKIVRTVNDLRPDLIALTGDLVDGSVAELAHDVGPISELSARHGAFFVTGNHEYYSGADPWVDEVRRLGLRVLMNQHVVVDHNGARAVIAGVTDYGAGSFDQAHESDPAKAMAGAPRDVAFRLLLAHQPRSATAASKAGFTLQLSGHTHGGQFLPWNFFIRLQQPFVHGLAKLNDLWVYTSRGTGYWGPPIRLGAPSEITRLRLVAGS
jgi:predicted MPP superfamily phosphohydrolase